MKIGSIQMQRALPLLALLVFASPLHAHRLDEYLQATLVEIEPTEVHLQINLTPGVQVAEQVLSAIDTDHDGAISPSEATAYAGLLKREMVVRLDERAVELKMVACNVPPAEELRSGWGIIQIEYAISQGALGAGPHHLTFENRHMSRMGVYLFNAAQPKAPSIQIVGQRRNNNQSLGEIEFAVAGSGSPDSRQVVGLSALLAVALIIAIAAVWGRRTIERLRQNEEQ